MPCHTLWDRCCSQVNDWTHWRKISCSNAWRNTHMLVLACQPHVLMTELLSFYLCAWGNSVPAKMLFLWCFLSSITCMCIFFTKFHIWFHIIFYISVNCIKIYQYYFLSCLWLILSVIMRFFHHQLGFRVRRETKSQLVFVLVVMVAAFAVAAAASAISCCIGRSW